MSEVIFNIYGGNNQILPNATEAVQNFYGNQQAEQKLAKDETPAPSEASPSNVQSESPACQLSEAEQRLLIYINNVETLRDYITQLRACPSARSLAEVVATMCQQEPSITDDLIVKQSFINLLLPFVPAWESGQSIDNIRKAINKAWAARKKALRRSER